MNEHELMQFGLTKNEAKIYVCLLNLGPSLAGQVSRKTGLHRRNVYDAGERLIEKGLVSYMKQNNRRLYQASSPQRFIDMIKEKEERILPVVDSLMASYGSSKEKEETNFFKGRDGLKAVLEDQLNYPEVLILGANPKAGEVIQFYFNWFNKTRVKKKVKLRIISHDEWFSRLPLSEVRVFPQKYASPVAINMYGDKTAIILWSKKAPLAIVIKQKEITDGYKNYFELLWKAAKKQTKK